MSNPNDLKYTQEHEWLRVEGEAVTLGISHFAQEQLGDIVFVELPAVGSKFEVGDSVGVVESTKSVSDIFTPVSGTIVEVNDSVVDEPERINKEPYGEGWLVKIKIDQGDQLNALMNAGQYESFVKENS